ncbi:hypothetical protein J6590_048947 [Homalodisca vitripennis]|nr:hypothetical protein J6590_048947 [Homalodisca vitripennis]
MENSGPVPYQMEMKVTSFSDSNMLSLRQSLEAALQTVQKSEPIKRLNIYKCLESIKYHLRKASPKVDEEKLSQVLHEIRDFFNRVSAKATLKDDR